MNDKTEAGSSPSVSSGETSPPGPNSPADTAFTKKLRTIDLQNLQAFADDEAATIEDDNAVRQQVIDFFNNNFWELHQKRNTHRVYSPGVRPFLHHSDDLYWEKAYINFLKHSSKTRTAADLSEHTMDLVYIACNIGLPIGGAFASFAKAAPIIGIIWNVVDIIGAIALACKESQCGDTWSAAMNLASAGQLAAGTAIFTILYYSQALHTAGLINAIGLKFGIAAAATSPLVAAAAAGASGFAFAAAMAFCWVLAHREVKLHEARIVTINRLILTKLNIKYEDSNEMAVLNSLEGQVYYDYVAKLAQDSKDPEILKLAEFAVHQQAELATQKRARRAWKYCTIGMTIVAAVSVAAVLIVGVAAAPYILPVMLTVAACLSIASALYRNYPKTKAVAKSSAKAAKVGANKLLGLRGLFKRTVASEKDQQDERRELIEGSNHAKQRY